MDVPRHTSEGGLARPGRKVSRWGTSLGLVVPTTVLGYKVETNVVFEGDLLYSTDTGAPPPEVSLCDPKDDHVPSSWYKSHKSKFSHFVFVSH